nr:MAG TPA: hypothetical protein [Caudoviricetes sp.]DAT86229.1 MAG TPA: hypothetical protein [Caudoviricetes sp.]
MEITQQGRRNPPYIKSIAQIAIFNNENCHNRSNCGDGRFYRP